ncbi:MAG: hypothetical protein JOZ01_01505 [Candidatus Eremiobacteraeota bacterium]|nr:hypothetical protein [Candidatus Eremiobacteraeota bacterium]
MLCACVLPGCGPRDSAYDPSSFRVHATIAPPDVAVPTNIGNTATEFNGLYLEGSDTFSCCWIAPHATLLVRKRDAARRLVGGFRLPDVPRFRSGQTIAIAFAHRTAGTNRIRLEPGEQRTVTLPVPASLRNATGLIPVDVTCAVDYIPSRDTPPSRSLLSMLHLTAQGANGDTRALGAVLLYLYFE